MFVYVCMYLVYYLCMHWFYRADLTKGLQSQEKSFEMCICLWQILINLRWPCTVDRLLKSSYWLLPHTSPPEIFLVPAVKCENILWTFYTSNYKKKYMWPVFFHLQVRPPNWFWWRSFSWLGCHLKKYKQMVTKVKNIYRELTVGLN